MLAVAAAMLPSLPPTAGAESSSITVVMDDNYPPYTFRDDEGRLQGILVDMWGLWSRKTGIQVDLRAEDWGQALKDFNGGQADVIDTIFRNPAREKIYDFSAPYADIDVPLVFDAELPGIKDASTAKGFTVGVKAGDSCIDVLKDKGLTTVLPYPSYESMADAAARGDLKVMCIDKPPAIYFLTRKGLSHRFRTSTPLYTGQFHWAVRRGETQTFQLVQAGFDQITKAERQQIEDRWLGSGLTSEADAEWRRNAAWTASVAGFAGLVLVAWVWALRRRVQARTAELLTTANRLALSEQRFRTIFDNVTEALFIHDAETGRILMVNRRMLEMYGCRLEEVEGLTVNDLSLGVPPYSQPEALSWIAKSADGPQVFEWQAKRLDGVPFWVEVSMRRAKIDDGPERLLVSVRDISERKEAEEHLSRSVDALTRSNTDLERFAYAASHDLREPMNTVVRFTQLLESRYKGRMDADADEFIGFIVKSAKQMMELVDGLLDYSRVNARTERFGPVDVARTIALIKDNLNAAIAESGAHITTGFLPVVQGDSIQLLQLLQNLIANSIKYRRPEVPPVIDIRCEADGGAWHFTVTDNGIGIEPEFYEQIFAIFRRLHTQASIPGIGVGLALCKRIVERHGGLIWVQPAPSGNGTQFHFTLSR